MKAKRIFYDKAVLPDNSIVEMTIWQLPKPSPERPHGLKYSLFYGRDGLRIVGYDNERRKGDHKHLGEVESRYRFVSVEKLVVLLLLSTSQWLTSTCLMPLLWTLLDTPKKLSSTRLKVLIWHKNSKVLIL